MPEGDTVFVATRRLHAALSGATLTRTDVRVPAFATADFSGQRVVEVVARGKHILLRTDGGVTLHTHLGMDGEWHLYRPGQRWRLPEHTARVALATEGWDAIGFKLPVVEVLPTAREHDAVGHLGPDLLGDDWDAEEAARRLAAHAEDEIADALIDQTVMAGLGNVYASEICFLAGVEPATRVSRLADLTAIVALSKRVIEANRETGVQITTGDTRPGRGRWVYGRRGEPCRRCGTRIRSRRRGTPPRDRVTYWCPSCQPAAE